MSTTDSGQQSAVGLGSISLATPPSQDATDGDFKASGDDNGPMISGEDVNVTDTGTTAGHEEDTQEQRGEDAGKGGKRKGGATAAAAAAAKRASKMSDSDSESGNNTTDTEYWVERTSGLNTSTIYRGYRTRLENRQQERDQKKKKASNTQSPALVKSLIDYLRVMENRLESLEKDREERLSSSKPHVSKDDDGLLSSEDGAEALTSFYDYRKEQELVFITREGSFSHLGDSFVKDDPRHVIQVLFKWERNERELERGTWPGPEDIDVLGIRINSEPIAKFLQEQTGFTLNKTNIIQFSKPLRPLIRLAAAFQKQFDILEAKFASGQDLQDTSAEQKSEIANQTTKAASDVVEGGVDITPDKQGVVADPPGYVQDDDFTGPYNSKKALLHFRALMGFMNKYAAKKLKLFNEYQRSIPPKVCFADLWMLFDSGATLFCPSRRGKEELNFVYFKHKVIERHVPQAYGVVSSVGGIPLARHFVPQDLVVKGAKQPLGELRLGKEENSGGMLSALWEEFIEQQSVDKARDKLTPLHLYCYTIDFDGRNLSVVPDFFNINPFDGEVDVTSLSVFPIGYQAQLQQHASLPDLKERGMKFLEYTRVVRLEHEGLTVGDVQEEINGPVMIDFSLAFQESPHLVPEFFDDQNFWGYSRHDFGSVNEMSIPNEQGPNTVDCYIDMEKTRYGRNISKLKNWIQELEADGSHKQSKKLKKAFSDSNLCLLLPGVVHGFSLHTRKWLQFDICQLREAVVLDGESGWNDLVLPQNHRTMVQSMVETHTTVGRQAPGSSGTRPGDSKYDIGLVRGKGKGCIILLHGVPGVGKTSTAECVAAYTGRPLFPITCADIGYEPEEVEKNLSKLFRMAHKWGCVLLIDEADVFLAERDKADVKRNGLVSVFLRVLEYYSGILFLTTNRVGAFDDAFRSRIHLTLYYPKLDVKQSSKIWRNNIKRIDRLNEQRSLDGLHPVRIDSKAVRRWAKENYETLSWNGRQIQNAFQTALALAEFEVRKKQPKSRRPEITIEHFKTIGEATIQFDNYLIETHMGDQATTAKQKGLRADKFATSGPPAAKERQIKMPRKMESSSSESSFSASGSDSDISKVSASEDENEKKGKKSSKSKASKSTDREASKKGKESSAKSSKSKRDKEEKDEEKSKETTEEQKSHGSKSKTKSKSNKSKSAKTRKVETSEGEDDSKDGSETDADTDQEEEEAAAAQRSKSKKSKKKAAEQIEEGASESE